jgi:AraC-like DNA-binding protein
LLLNLRARVSCVCQNDFVDLLSDKTSLQQHCRLRSTLEAFAVAACHEAGNLDDLRSALDLQLIDLQNTATCGDYLAFHRQDFAFHRTLMEAAGMEILTRNWQSVAEALDAWILAVKHECWPSLMALYREHELLVEEWTGKDLQVAQDACHRHLEQGWERMIVVQNDTAFAVNPVERAVSFLSSHFASKVDVEFLARHVSHTSSSNLHRLFRERLGMPPYAFLRQLRLEHAAQLLRSTKEPISSIARRCGYQNLSHFSRDFRSKYGATPKASRI